MNDLLLHEYNLWKSLSDEAFDLDGYRFIINSSFSKSKVGFMNIAIPKNGIIKDVYSRSELETLNSIFKDRGSTGNIIVKSGYESIAVENSEYYLLEKNDSNQLENSDFFETEDIFKFSEIVTLGFGFDESFTNYFYKRMIEMKKKLNSKFFFLKKRGEIVSSCSFFKKHPGSLYCAMNGCTLSEYRGYNYFDELILSASTFLDTGVFGRTNNKGMCKSLEKAEFYNVGNISIVPLQKILKKKL